MPGVRNLRDVMDDVTAAVAPLRDLLGKEAWRVPERDLLDALGALHRARSALDLAHLDVIREIDARGVAGSAGSAPVATTTEGLVREVTGASPGRARRDVVAARAIGPEAELAGFRDRLADGRVRREHVDVAVSCLDRLPKHLIREPAARAAATQMLLSVSDDRADDRDLERFVRRLLAGLDPDGGSRHDPDAAERAFLDLRTDSTGMVVGRFQLDPVAGATLRKALETRSAPESAHDVDGRLVRDDRPARRRRADALAVIAETALGVSVPRRGERPRVVVRATPQQLADLPGAGMATLESGEPVPAWVLGRLACDAVLQRVVDDPSLGPLDVGRAERLVTLAQRRALSVRDHGCVICGAEPDWCDAHHVVPWSEGGATDLANLVLLCPGHHTAVHAGSWQIDVDDGPAGEARVWLTPPGWVDPARVPRRPVAHQLNEAVARMEEWLRTRMANDVAWP